MTAWCLSPQAALDLEDIADYVAEQSASQEVAMRLLDKFEQTFTKPAEIPTLGRARVELSGPYASLVAARQISHCLRP